MDNIYKMTVRGLLLLLISYIAAVTSQGQLSGSSDIQTGVSRLQEVVCAFTPYENQVGDSIDMFGGSIHDFHNGSVLCRIEDDTVKLHCFTMTKLINTTDVFGNYTTKIEITIAGCLSKEAQDSTRCTGPEEKCSSEITHGKLFDHGYCCCSGINCNHRNNLELFSPRQDDPESPAVSVESEMSGEAATTALVAGIMTPLLVISAILIVSFYICRKKREEKQLALQNKVEQYKYDMSMYSHEPPTVNYDDLKLELCLHRGRFGEVYRAKLNDGDVCVKYFHSSQRSLFHTEKEIYDILDSNIKTVVQCLACDERTHSDGSVQYIVIMEYIPYGSLASYIKSHTLNWRDMYRMASTAANGLGYLHGETFINGVHKHAVVHRDVNSRNILVRSDMSCALADMGFSMKIRGSKVIKQGVEEHAEDGSLRDVGTVRYMAPEILDCAVNLRDCESSLKQIDMYAFSLVLWELLTRCKDLLLCEPKRFVLPFEDELGSHPGFETMRIHVAKDGRRPSFPINMKQTEATQLLRETIEECWDADSEARLTAVCVEERLKDMDNLMEGKSSPELSHNDVMSSSHCDRHCDDVMCGSSSGELSPLLEIVTPGSERSNATTMTTLQTPCEPASQHIKPDVNVEMEKDRQLAPKQGRNILVERNTLHSLDEDEELAVHENTLIPLLEAKARRKAEEERKRRAWEASQQQQQQQDEGVRRPSPPSRSVQLDIHNEVRDVAPPPRVKENNLNVRRHNSQRNIYESSTSSNGAPGMIVTIPTPVKSTDKLDTSKLTSRPKSLNIQLNIKPEET